MGPLFLLLFLHILLPEPVSSAATSPVDAAALQSLARFLSPLPPGWTASSSSDPCSPSPKWTGVSCSSGRVTFLNLRSLSLSGSLPASSLSPLTSLRSLSLQSNSLTGPLPSPLPSSLQELYLGSNNFSSLPSGFFSGLTSLVNASLDKNPLAPWSLPDDLQQSVNLVYFSAMDSGLTGEIPAFLGKLVSLQMLRLSYNQLTGSLPTSFTGSSIRELYLNNQDSKLSGPIDVIAAMPQLSVLMLQSNNFTGPIPDLTNCTSLQELNLRDNRLTGLVPASISHLPALTSLTLTNNLLQGPYPDIPATIWKDGGGSGNFFCLPTPGPCEPRVAVLLAIAEGFGYPAALANAWTGNDPCNNWLFVSCDAQQNITLLNFANQKFGGVISPEITKLTSLKNLILSNNDLHGTIPVELASMPQLESVDVSDNDLSGDLPPFKPNVKFKYSGNKLIGTGSGSSGSTSGGESRSGGSSPPGDNSSSGSGSKPPVWIAGVVVGVLVIVGVVCVFFYCRRRQHPKFRKVQVQSPSRESEGVKIGMQGFVTNGISHNELYSQSSSDSRSGHAIDAVATFMSMQAIRQATNNFGEGNILGRGGFGTVYKGEFPDGMLIAVKRMECGEMGNKGLTEFQAEIAVLTKVRHRHLVALHGYCVEGSERLLVYEYMPQGTLAQHLFGGVEMGYASLRWKQRLIIALDVARGLEYLHSLAQKSFIHRDLKPSNILLGDDMRAKVSDFGLVKLAPDGKYSVETRLAGTFGYLAPEYATTGRVTTKVDVYAFGVVLMELITGRKALDDTLPEENTHLVTWFRRYLVSKSNVSKIADPSLDLEDDDVRSLATVAELAGHCTAREAHQRPDMGHAVNVIAPLVDQWKPSSSNAYDDNMGMSFNRSLSQRLKGWQQNEGTSMVNLDSDSHVISMENTHGSIPSKPDMFTHCR